MEHVADTRSVSLVDLKLPVQSVPITTKVVIGTDCALTPERCLFPKNSEGLESAVTRHCGAGHTRGL
jgi:hypothetical protein